MASACERKGDMVRRVNSKGKVGPLVAPLLPKPQFANNVTAKRPLVEERELPSIVKKKQRLSDQREVVDQVASPDRKSVV